MALASDPLRHFLLEERFRGAESYATKGSVRPKRVPPKDREGHGAKLKGELQQIQTAYSQIIQDEVQESYIRSKGLIIEIVVPDDFAEQTKSLDRSDKLQLLNQKPFTLENGEEHVSQTWFVPDGHLSVLEQIFNDYLTKDSRFQKPAYHSLVDSIESLKVAALEQLWTEIEPMPQDDADRWWEVWLRAEGIGVNREEIITQFKSEAAKVGLRVGEQRVTLPEHTILAVRGPVSAFRRSLPLLNCLAEIRLGRDFAGDYEALPVEDQMAWAEDLHKRLEGEPPLTNPRKDERVALCVMDTGVNRGHPMLADRLPEDRNLAIKDAWGSFDEHGLTGHGTPMAGLCLYGDLTQVLPHAGQVDAPFVLEAVKIVPPPHLGNDEEKLAAGFTQSGVYLVEGRAPFRKRVWCIATSLEQPGVDGRPGSWSAALDALASGSDGDLLSEPRLICLAAGNMPMDQWRGYPEENEGYSAHPPAQAWNVLAVGSFTQLDQIRTTPRPQSVLAPQGGMSPTNSTSCTWNSDWPNKPDVVFEGGNAECDAGRHNAWEATDLSLLSTAADFQTSPFCTLVGTSPATAQAARMAARIHAAYPDFWPETVRGLMVHSARWTPAMLATVTGTGKRAASALLRKVGYGVPRLHAALECARSRATLISQAEMQPFRSMPQASKDPQMNELHTHSLPWPREKLLAHPFEKIQMRVTLSYFIEPNPGNRGYTSTYRYAGCQLRFKVSSPGQELTDLVAEIDKTTDDLVDGVPGTLDNWKLDPGMIGKGSVHSNVWEGRAADLADMRHIIVYPVSGWWKTRKALKRADSTIRYSLLITLEAENPDLDIYTEIENVITPTVDIS